MRRFTVFFVAVLVGFAATAQRFGRAPTKDDFVGRWVGFESSYLDFFSLWLANDGTGRLVVLYNEGAPDIYHIEWTVANNSLVMRTSEVSKAAERIVLRVKSFRSDRIPLMISGVTNQWNHEAVLFNEKKLLGKMMESSLYGSEQKPK